MNSTQTKHKQTMNWLKNKFKDDISYFKERAKTSKDAQRIVKELIKQYNELFGKKNA